MDKDIVERLRRGARDPDSADVRGLMHEAADEIERLQEFERRVLDAKRRIQADLSRQILTGEYTRPAP